VSFEQEAQDLLNKYLDEVEAMLDNRHIKDPITNEERRPDERFLRAVEEKIHISESGKQSFRQEVVRKAMGAYKRGVKFGLDSHLQLNDAVQQYLCAPKCRPWKSGWSMNMATTATARAKR
jgi:serine protein kinase